MDLLRSFFVFSQKREKCVYTDRKLGISAEAGQLCFHRGGEMKYLAAAYTRAGKRKRKNQDSMVLMEAETDGGNILFAAVCDGMGGLEEGEAASAAMANAFADWFENGLPSLLQAPREKGGALEAGRLWAQWAGLIGQTGCAMETYGKRHHVTMGTTAVGILFCGEYYYILHVGDSRAYLLTDGIRQLTRDQTYVQRELDAGRMTCEQSLTDPRRSVLLQCIGAGVRARPAFSMGRSAAGQVFLVCSDGFCHAAAPREIYRAFLPEEMTCEEVMRQRLAGLGERIADRGEEDDISALLVRLIRGKMPDAEVETYAGSRVRPGRQIQDTE